MQSFLLENTVEHRPLPQPAWNRPECAFANPLKKYFNGQWRKSGDEFFGRSLGVASLLDRSALSAFRSDDKTGKASRHLAYTFLVRLAWLDKYELGA